MKKSQLKGLIREAVNVKLRKEGAMSELDILMDESRNFADFLNKIKSDPKFKSVDVNSPEVEDFLRTMWDDVMDKGSALGGPRLAAEGLIKRLVREELKILKAKKALFEGVTPEATQLHTMVNCGQDAAQNFFDEHNIDAKKLVTYVQQNKQTNPTLVYDVRDYISGAKGSVGGEKNLRDRFIKQFQINAPMREGVSWKPSSNANVEGFASKSFPLGGKGDALLQKPEFIKKWAPRIQAWIGVEPKLDQVDSFFPSQQGMDFKFQGSDGKTYRIYSPGESPRSKQYVIQKMK